MQTADSSSPIFKSLLNFHLKTISQNPFKILLQVTNIYVFIHIKFGLILFSHFLTPEVRSGPSAIDLCGQLCHQKFKVLIYCCIHVLDLPLNNFQIGCFLFTSSFLPQISIFQSFYQFFKFLLSLINFRKTVQKSKSAQF